MFWDRVAFVYDIFVEVINRKTHNALKKIVADLIGPGDEVLECACGTGMLTEVIAPKCVHITATDLSGKMLKRAEKKCRQYTNVSFAKADIDQLAFADGSFDKVIAANVIHLLDDPLHALKELERVCRPGGMLIIPTYMNKEKGQRPDAFSETVRKAGADFKHDFTFAEYEDFFREAGYSDVKIRLAEGRIPCAVAVIRKQ
ncbi:MAG: class I SAM-dependent methyltransferase [Erysipelotrichaceae bacterium]|nr:class I SAM-dependent methyltransferase [Erysipelotrichaceae bacterium]